MNSNDVKQMVIYDIRIDEDANAFVLILVDVENKVFLPIWIGHFEATAILLELKDVKPQRPFTHDLLKNIIEEMGGKPVRVVIDDLRESTFYAKIHMYYNDRLLEIDSRPSDAVALAVRARVPIFASSHVLDSAGIKIDSYQSGAASHEQGELFEEELNKKIEEFRNFLSHVNPEDFKE